MGPLRDASGMLKVKLLKELTLFVLFFRLLATKRNVLNVVFSSQIQNI